LAADRHRHCRRYDTADVQRGVTLAGEAIPEPSTLLLIGAALVALALLRIRR